MKLQGNGEKSRIRIIASNGAMFELSECFDGEALVIQLKNSDDYAIEWITKNQIILRSK